MRIGLFGGTFNPVHNGHLALAEAAKSNLRLDKVIFIPAYMPPHKQPNRLADAEDRYSMLELAMGKRYGFEVSRFEIDKKEKSYSVDTLEYFMKLYPKDTEFFFLIGADSLEGLDNWKDADKLFRLCRFAVCNRPGFSIETAHANVESFGMPPVNISSTYIRERIKKNQAISGLVPARVENYIKEKNLYK